ncbi:MFS transporter [Microbulbifer sp. CAU 1566]|uniref:MFS transporter n=1 Tax=Microbulbifer sp. CAU 1566 TaxID=2933269 RepID=UPI0020046052|nr:MFS transporter [Microbulbifer sp. CAU 1566]MCK7595768.1 MFS transporter [Microbulbifer sp. CAU 1566]
MAFPALAARLRTFLLGYSGTSLATGLQVVLLPWIAVSMVELPALQLGWVQASVLLPNLILLLFGGALADRFDSARVAALSCIGLGLCHSALAFYLLYQVPSLSLLLVYGISLGICMAFLQPARDNLVQRCARKPEDGSGRLSESRVQHTVTWMMLAQYGGQAIGMLLASRFDHWGAEPLLLIQVFALMLAALFFFFMRHLGPAPKAPKLKLPSALLEGFAEVKKSRAISELVLLVGFNGLVHIGVFLVVLPLMADSYDRGASYYATLQIAFIAGTVVATVAMLRRGQGNQPGRGVLMCLLYSAALLIAISFGPTPFGLMLLCACWGAVAAASAALGKSIVQLLAPEQVRSRIISIYQLSLFGSAAIGALAAGVISEFSAPLTTLWWAGIFSLVAFVLAWFSGALRELSVRDSDAENPQA